MQNMSSASKKFFLFISFLLQFLANFWLNAVGRLSKETKTVKILTSNASSSKLLSENMLQFVGKVLHPDSAQKMKETSKQWSNVKIYENIFPNECEVAVLRNVSTGEIMWETITFTESWNPMPKQEKLVSHLRRNDSEKWSDVFVWLDKNFYNLMYNNESQNEAFLKKLMLAMAENVVVTFTNRYGKFPLMLAAAIDDTDSILTLIKRGTDVNHQNGVGNTALHVGAYYGNMNACAALLENNANIDAAARFGSTPLIVAAAMGNKNVFEFLIEKRANKNLINNAGKTASQLARFQERESNQKQKEKL